MPCGLRCPNVKIRAWTAFAPNGLPGVARSVGLDPHHLAVHRVEALRAGADRGVAHGDEQRGRAGAGLEAEPAAVVEALVAHPGDDRGRRAERAVGGQARVERHPHDAVVARAQVRHADVEKVVGREVGIDGETHQAALAAGVDAGDRAEHAPRFQRAHVGADRGPVVLGVDHRARRQEREIPGSVETGDVVRVDGERRRVGRQRDVGRRSRQARRRRRGGEVHRGGRSGLLHREDKPRPTSASDAQRGGAPDEAEPAAPEIGCRSAGRKTRDGSPWIVWSAVDRRCGEPWLSAEVPGRS